MAEKYYNTLQSFLNESGVTVLDFSDRIRMFSEMFKELLSTRSKMTIGTFMSVLVGCKGIIDEKSGDETKKELHILYTQLFEEYLAENEEAFLSVTNPHFCRKIEDMADFASTDIYNRIHHLYHPNETVSSSFTAEDPMEALRSILLTLNQEGCRELIKRARELTYVPCYKKS